MREAPGFYGVIVGSMALGLALVGFRVNPIRALYFAAVFNGVTAPPLIRLIILLARSPSVMGEFRPGRQSLAATSLAFLATAAFPIAALLLG